MPRHLGLQFTTTSKGDRSTKATLLFNILCGEGKQLLEPLRKSYRPPAPARRRRQSGGVGVGGSPPREAARAGGASWG
eukprot:15447415-Alexandrium_andersonii.AAC.1